MERTGRSLNKVSQSTTNSPSPATTFTLVSSMASQSKEALRRLPEPEISGDPARPVDVLLRPTSSLERWAQSTPSSKVWKKRESEGVGLGIVAALEKSPEEKYSPKVVVGGANLHLTTAPIAIGSARSVSGRAGPFPAAAQSSCCGDGGRKEIADESPRPSAAPVAEELDGFRMADFLSCCNLCRKSLHGQDVYMYRGEKAFCSTECRHQQMASEEYQEKRGAGVRKPTSTEISSSPCSGDRLFFTGIVVT